MIWSDDSEDDTFRYEGFQEWNWRMPDCMVASELYTATCEGDLPKVRRLIESGESVNKKEPYEDYRPLHMAVIYNKSEILDYLLAQEGVEVDACNIYNKTPLHLAVSFRRIKLIEKLIQAGCDINISDGYTETALSLSLDYYPMVPYFPVQGDTENLNNTRQAAVMPEELDFWNLDILYMLLYYNVDVNIVDSTGYTAFMYALAYGYDKAQEVLFEYEDDFNRFINLFEIYITTMALALMYNSPLIKDMIERGADINYGDDPRITEERSAFSYCLLSPVALSTFKVIWERLQYNDSKNTIDLLRLFGSDRVEVLPTFLQVIIESDNFEVAVQCLSKGEKYVLFVDKFAEGKFDLEQLTALTCRLLEHGFRPSSYDVHAIFSHYGYCELFRILLYMDIDFTRGWLPHMALTRLIFDIDFDLKSIATQANDIPKDALVQLLEHSICPRLVDALTLQYSEDESMSAILRSIPKVPSLMELARNPARKHIWHSFKITNNCQFYTRIDYLNIPTFYKAVLTFKRKMYVVK